MYDQIIKTGYHIYNYVNIFISSANTRALVVILLSFVHVLSIQVSNFENYPNLNYHRIQFCIFCVFNSHSGRTCGFVCVLWS